MKKTTVVIWSAFICLIATSIFSMCVGRYNIGVLQVFQALIGQGPATIQQIVLRLRLPRIICAVLIGAALSSAGIAYQGLFQNPLVSPDLLGVSSGACVGAVLSILLGLNSSTTMLLAFVMGVFSVGIAVILSMITKRKNNTVMVFAGIIVGRFMSSIVGMLVFFADNESQLGAIIEWEMGSFAKVTTTDLMTFCPILTVCTLVLLLLRWRINLLSVGEHEAKALGVDLMRERILVIVVSTFATAVSVCIAGTIAWIGLIIPHISRWIIRDDNRYSMPMSIFLGGIALVLSDTMARSLLPYELPLEVITGLAGAPIFAWIMVKRWKT